MQNFPPKQTEFMCGCKNLDKYEQFKIVATVAHCFLQIFFKDQNLIIKNCSSNFAHSDELKCKALDARWKYLVSQYGTLDKLKYCKAFSND